jgi:Spy/CpxP family protein refolding chaperone
MTLFGNTGKNARLIGTALLIITFIAGGLAGAAVVRVLSAESNAKPGVEARKGAPPMKGAHRRLLLDPEFAAEIGLTTEQRAQIEEILDRRDVEAKKLWDGFEPRLKQFGQQVHNEIDAVLTPDQKQKLDAALEQRRGDHKRRRECPDSSKAKTTEKAS